MDHEQRRILDAALKEADVTRMERQEPSGRGARTSWRAALFGLWADGFMGCRPSSPEAVADRFIDSYVVEMDQSAALPLCEGLAKEMLERELRDVAAVRSQMGGKADEGRPDVFYKRLGTQTEGDRRVVRYELTIKQGRDATQRSAQVALSKIGDNWRVVFYHIGEGR